MDSQSLSTLLTGLNIVYFFLLIGIVIYLRAVLQSLEALTASVSRMDTYVNNLARDIGNRFDGLDRSLETVSRSTADAFGLVKDELREIQASFRGFQVALDTFRQSQSTALHNVEVPLSEVRDIVSAFKNDLSTEVRLSREDYEELMATAESKNTDVLRQLNDLRLTFATLQSQVADFRNKFDAFTE